MKNIWILIFLVLAAIVLAFVLFSFQVRETEVAVLKFLGEPREGTYNAGLHFRWPPPINEVHKFDARYHLFEGDMEETTTKGGDPIVVSTYVVWRVGDAWKYLEAVRNKIGAEDQLRGLLRDTQNSVVGQYYFSEFVNSDRDKIKFAVIEEKMLSSLQEGAMTNYGIEIKAVGIKQLGVSKDVTADVFERMKADRQRKTAIIEQQGEAIAATIRSDAESKRIELLAEVDAEAKAIRGAGDAEAAKYYKMLEADPDLAMFLRDIEALKKILKEKSTIVLGADTAPIKLLKEVPNIEPKK